MKKILYITFIDKLDKKNAGVLNKINDQCEAFNELGVDVAFSSFSTYEKYQINYKSRIIDFNLNSKSRRTSRSRIKNVIIPFLIENNIDSVYIRGESFDNIFLDLISNIKKNGLNVILEIPTYPIYSEIKSKLKDHLLNKDFMNFMKILLYIIVMSIVKVRFKKYISFIVTYMDFSKIWDIPVCVIDNGINNNRVSIKKKFINNGEIKLIGVANVSKWHGYDRVIKGLNEYKGNINVNFSVIGDGDEIPNLRELVNKYGLENKVKFFGYKNSSELDKFFDESDIAISSLGMHRINLDSGSTLKTKEYFARGIPFVLAYKEKKLMNIESNKYFMQISNNESNVNIEELVVFYQNLNKENIINEMRKFSEDNFSWIHQIKLIIEMNNSNLNHDK